MTAEGGREDGFALVTALWAALILGLIGSYVVMASRTDARILRTAIVQAEQHAAAEGVLGLLQLRLLGPQAATLPLDGTPFAMKYGVYSAQVVLQDQSGLIDLNSAPFGVINRLFTAVGRLNVVAAQSMSDRILDWRERGAGRRLSGAKAGDYAAAGYAYGPREAPFESVEELKLVMGMTSALYERVCPALTVYAQRQTVNPETAPVAVLATLPGMTEDEINRVVAERAGRRAQQAPAPGFLGTADGQAIEISLTIGDSAHAKTTLRTAMRLIGDPAHPYWTLMNQ